MNPASERKAHWRDGLGLCTHDLKGGAWMVLADVLDEGAELVGRMDEARKLQKASGIEYWRRGILGFIYVVQLTRLAIK